MKCTVQFFLLNEHFSQEHADAHYNGKDSENNRKYEWEDELVITTSVDSIETHEGASFPLKGTLPDGKDFEHSVQDMRMFELKGEVPAFVGCSESILDSFEVEYSEELRLKVFLKDFEPMANPVPGIYIAAQEFPKELVF